MVLTVDRIENEYAVCEDELCVMHDIKCDLLPADVKEGSRIESSDDGYVILPDLDSSWIRMRFNRLRKKRTELEP